MRPVTSADMSNINTIDVHAAKPPLPKPPTREEQIDQALRELREQLLASEECDWSSHCRKIPGEPEADKNGVLWDTFTPGPFVFWTFAIKRRK